MNRMQRRGKRALACTWVIEPLAAFYLYYEGYGIGVRTIRGRYHP